MNASLFGLLEAAADCSLHGVLNGFQGLAEDRVTPLPRWFVEEHRRASHTPGAWLGAGRWPAGEADFERFAGNLERRGIGGLAIIGGNGTMWACRELERAARRSGYDLRVVGIPKTVDNDLAGTDHAPGFGSAARFVAALVRDVGRDLQSVKNFESVRILETMGRNVGWLAMSAGLLKERPEDPPHLIYIPERPFDEEVFLREVEETHRRLGYALAVVSEGLTPHETEAGLKAPILGGVSRELAGMVNDRLDLPARGELLGMGQRAFTLAVSERDRQEARMLGEAAAYRLRSGESGVMLALARKPGSRYAVEVWDVPFDEVAGAERALPAEWVPDSPAAVPEGFRRWLAPLAGEDLAAYPPNLAE